MRVHTVITVTLTTHLFFLIFCVHLSVHIFHKESVYVRVCMFLLICFLFFLDLFWFLQKWDPIIYIVTQYDVSLWFFSWKLIKMYLIVFLVCKYGRHLLVFTLFPTDQYSHWILGLVLLCNKIFCNKNLSFYIVDHGSGTMVNQEGDS